MMQNLVRLIFPPFCIGCLQVQGHFICGNCRLGIQKIGKQRCLQCGSPSSQMVKKCLDCQHYTPVLDRVEALYLYEGALISIIHNLKYHHCGIAAKVLGKLLALKLRSFAPYAKADFIVPIPIAFAKEKERGYNQSLLLAEALSAFFQIPILHCLVKKKETPSQSQLDRDKRLTNLQNAFAYREDRKKNRKRLKGKSIILIDDVSTTGATLLEASGVLKEEGKARKVFGAVVGRSPRSLKSHRKEK